MDIRSWALEMGFDEAEAIPAAMLPRAQELLPGARALWILVTAHRPFDPGDWPEDGLVVASHYPASQLAYHRTRRLAARIAEAGCSALAHPMLPAKKAALLAGIGWMGRQDLLHHPRYGTYVCLHLLLTDQEEKGMTIRKVLPSLCGACQACVDACPTGAVQREGGIDPARCLRAYMLEGVPFPEDMLPFLGRRLVGCESCQLACPHNAFVGFAPVPPELREAVRLLGASEETIRTRCKDLAGLLGKNLIRPQRLQEACALCERSLRMNSHR